MTTTAGFLHQLLHEGRVLLREAPEGSIADDSEAEGLLRQAFADYRLTIAGPPVAFDLATATAAADFIHRACWYLVSREEARQEMEKKVTIPPAPTSAAHHLSADLVFRYLPQVHRRAQAVVPDDRLVDLLAAALRRWPLSGVGSDVADAPLTPPRFDGHHGLMLLYAERLARNPKPAWFPEGAALEVAELVFAGLGRAAEVALRRQALVPDKAKTPAL
jgi:hypothetical protein